MKILLILLTIFEFGRASPSFLVDPNCPDYNLSIVCTDRCDNEYLECVSTCSSSECLMECSRANVACSDLCPCHTDCIDGCVGCQNPVCFCNDDKDEDNINACIEKNNNKLGQCILNCENDSSCETDCVSRFKNDHSKCPCQSKCSSGCPCDQYECNLPEKKAILVLHSDYINSDDPHSPALLIQPGGGLTEHFEFKMDDNTQVRRSCSALLNGELFIFGGYNEKTQISKVEDCRLKRVGNLDYAFDYGTCGSYFFPENRVLLCFGWTEDRWNKCESFDGDLHYSHPDSTVNHTFTTLANIDGSPLSVGGYLESQFDDGQEIQIDSNRTEIFDIQTNKWIEVEEYPYHSTIRLFATVTTAQGALIIGGRALGDNSAHATVACYNRFGWSRLDDLQSPRAAHSAIVNGDKIFVIGGSSAGSENDSGSRYTEIWSIDETSKYIKLAEPKLVDYSQYPALLLVDTKYCVNQ